LSLGFCFALSHAVLILMKREWRSFWTVKRRLEECNMQM